MFANNAILCPRKNDVEYINSLILKRMAGESKTYLSKDTIAVHNRRPLSVHAADAAIDRVNQLTPGNLPSHKLELKVGFPVSITRNICIPNGLCNGTRGQILKMNQLTATVKVTTGPAAGSIVLIGPVRNEHGTQKNFKGTAFDRLQLPLRPCAAMTINRGQGMFLLDRCFLDR